MVMRTAAVAVFLSLVALRPSWANDTPAERQTLKGAESFGLVVEDLEPEAERDGLTKAQLQTDVETRLRQSGIRVDNNAAIHLYVAVNLLKVSGRYVYSVRIEFVQPVIVRLTNDVAWGTTWSMSSVGFAEQTVVSRYVRDVVRDKIDQFVNAFLSVNPKP